MTLTRARSARGKGMYALYDICAIHYVRLAEINDVCAIHYVRLAGINDACATGTRQTPAQAGAGLGSSGPSAPTRLLGGGRQAPMLPTRLLALRA